MMEAKRGAIRKRKSQFQFSTWMRCTAVRCGSEGDIQIDLGEQLRSKSATHVKGGRLEERGGATTLTSLQSSRFQIPIID